MQPLNLGLRLLESHLELLYGHLKIFDVGGCEEKLSSSVDFWSGLLVGHGQGILEPAVTIRSIPQLVSPLLRLDALATDGLAAHVGAASRVVGGRSSSSSLSSCLVASCKGVPLGKSWEQ